MDENKKDFLRSQLEDYIKRNGVDTHKSKFVCAICGDKNRANFVPDIKQTIWKCFSANKNLSDMEKYPFCDRIVKFS